MRCNIWGCFCTRLGRNFLMNSLVRRRDLRGLYCCMVFKLRVFTVYTSLSLDTLHSQSISSHLKSLIFFAHFVIKPGIEQNENEDIQREALQTQNPQSNWAWGELLKEIDGSMLFICAGKKSFGDWGTKSLRLRYIVTMSLMVIVLCLRSRSWSSIQHLLVI